MTEVPIGGGKPPLVPAYRRLPPRPPRASRKSSATPFPPARFVRLSGPGAEDVVANAAGHLFCGLADGRIVEVRPGSGEERTIANTGGRPLGLEVLSDGRILVCDAYRGLLRIEPASGAVEVLVREVGGSPLRFCSNVVALPDGTCFFTESTCRFGFEHHLGAMLEHRPSGRLFRRDPAGRVETVLDGLHFANGLTLVDAGTALVFAETDGYRLSRLQLAGPHAGACSPISENLPGFPDNLSRTSNGRFWVAMVAARSPLLDGLGRAPAWLRRLLWATSRPRRATSGTTWVMAFDGSGAVVADLQVKRADFFGATGVVEVGDRLYLAGVDADGLLEVRLR